MDNIFNKEAKFAEIQENLAKITNPEDQARAIRSVLIALEIGKDRPEKLAVVLIHGIRTHAEWQEKIKQEFHADENIKVIPLGYDYLDLIKFWIPFLFRIYPIRRVEQQLRNIASENKDSKVVVIAHSFGTYIISKILKRRPDIRIERLLLCGSIIKTNLRWDLVPQRPKLILNDVGDKDILPVLAKAGSWGYGASGTFGFKANEVIDRFHNFGHSDFFDLSHIKIFWTPFIKEAYIAPSKYEENRIKQAYCIKLLNFLPIKTIFLIFIIWRFDLLSLFL